MLCFDEVMTGFRVARGCAQEHFGVTPDICTMGKVIGGGLPVGAFGGKREIMETVAPAGPMYQSGTLSGNPLAMVSGMKTLEILDREGSYAHLDAVTKKLVAGIEAAGKKHGVPVVAGSVGGAPPAPAPSVAHHFSTAVRHLCPTAPYVSALPPLFVMRRSFEDA